MGLKTYLPLGLVVGRHHGAGNGLRAGRHLVRRRAPQAAAAADYNNARALGTGHVHASTSTRVEVGAALLLVGMVAAIALTLRGRRDTKYQ